MRILFLAPEFSLRLNMNGGAGTHMRATINELKSRGHDVVSVIGGDIFENKKQSTPDKVYKKFNIKNIFKKIIPNEILMTISDFKIYFLNKKIINYIVNKLDLSNFDVIYERSGYGYNSGTYLSKKFNIPHILETDVIMLDLKTKSTSFIFNKYVYRILEKRKYHSADTIVVQSEYSVKFCKKYWNINHSRIYNKDLGVKIIETNDQDKKISVINNQKFKNKIVIGFVGYFLPYQKIELFLEVAKKFTHDKDILFLLVGGGTIINKLKKIKVDNKLDNVIFTGIVDNSQVKEYYKFIDIGIIPNCAFHMYPVKFLEYIINDLIALIPKYEVFEEFYINNETYEDFTFKPNDSSSLYQKLMYAIKNLNEFKSKMKYTKDYVINNKTWKNTGENLEIILNKTVVCEK